MTTRAVVLDEDGIENLKAVLEYNWRDELEDYAEQRAAGRQSDELEDHIFRVMVELDQIVYGHTKTAEEFYQESRAANEWPPYDAATATGMYDREDG